MTAAMKLAVSLFSLCAADANGFPNSGSGTTRLTYPSFLSGAALAKKKNNVSHIISSMSSAGAPVDQFFGVGDEIQETGDKTVQQLREELKSRLLVAADEFSTMKAESDKLALKVKELGETPKEDRWFVPRLVNKIVRKISRRKSSEDGGKSLSLEQSNGILTSDSFRQVRLDVGAAGERVIDLAEQLSMLNPTPIPTLGFKHYGGVPPTDSKLGGRWKLRFTTAADASFSESKTRGVATTSQVIDAERGTLTNVVDFEKGSLKGFRVVVAGDPTSATDIGLSFQSVKILRNSRFPRLFGEFTIWLPTRLIRYFATRNKPSEEKEKGPYLRLKYVDENLRMHVTGEGNWFIQSRLE